MKQSSLRPLLTTSSKRNSLCLNPLLEKSDCTPFSSAKKDKLNNAKSFTETKIEVISKSPSVQPPSQNIVQEGRETRSKKKRSRDEVNEIPPKHEKKKKYNTEEKMDEEEARVKIDTFFDKSKAKKAVVQPEEANTKKPMSNEIIKENNSKAMTSETTLQENKTQKQVAEGNSIIQQKKSETNEQKEETKNNGDDLRNNNMKKSSELLSRQTNDIIANLREKKKSSAPSVSSVNTVTEQTNQIKSGSNPQISSKTQEVISQIIQSPSTTQSTAGTTQNTAGNSQISSASIKEKYEELLLSERDFILPYEYKRLLNLFEAMDSQISILKIRRTPSFLSNLISSLENQIKMRITEKQIAQIMYVMPEAYQITWEVNEKNGRNYELYLTPGKNENQLIPEEKEGPSEKLSTALLDHRKAEFKARLIEITRTHHRKFLAGLPAEEQTKDYEAMKTWNSKFDVHGVPAVPEAKLPPKPNVYRSQSLSEFLQENDIKHKAVAEVLKETLNKGTPQLQKSGSLPSNDVQSKNKNGLSEQLLMMIKKKEQLLNEKAAQQQMARSQNASKCKKAEMKQIAAMIYIYYYQRGVSSMFFTQLVDHLHSVNQKLLLSKGEITEYVEKLAKKICPNWLKFKTLDSATLLQMDKSIATSDVQETIEKAFAENLVI